MFPLHQAVETFAEKWESAPPEEHIPLSESMMSLSFEAIAVSGMGKVFKNPDDLLKFARSYEQVGTILLKLKLHYSLEIFSY